MPGSVVAVVGPGEPFLDGALELYVLMSNAGLPEAGDMILAFAPELLADDRTYRGLADLPAGARTTDDAPDAAMARRDAAVDGFHHWRNAVMIFVCWPNTSSPNFSNEWDEGWIRSALTASSG